MTASFELLYNLSNRADSSVYTFQPATAGCRKLTFSNSVRFFHSIYQRNRAYFFRFQMALVCSLLLFILLFRYWPVYIDQDDYLNQRFDEEEAIGPEFIVTSPEFSVERIAPPVPRPDITVPDEEVVDMEYDLDVGEMGEGEGLAPFGAEEGEPEIVEQPDRRPSVRRIVEPVMPSQARRDGVRVEIVVLFVVSDEGEVIEASIDEMRMYNEQTGRFEVVSETGYGFREVTLRAASQWLFHAAEYDGDRVRARARHRFTFGN